MVEQAEHRNPVEILAEEFLDRHRSGESCSIGEYAHNYPALADEIRQLFPMMLAMEQVKTARFSSSGRALELQIDAPAQLGDFRIIREIARGGMGVVYEAEQVSLCRRVAVKVIPPQLLSDPRQLERFHQEARTAASLHHTNIVPVFGVGEQDGLHYYVMQKIDGAALDRSIADTDHPFGRSTTALSSILKPYPSPSADTSTATSAAQLLLSPNSKPDSVPHDATTAVAPTAHSATVAEWRSVAEIGIQVAEALAYAHEQGVLHQDIKPGNLLLDPHGTVWVTDFGLATALSDEQINNDGVGGTLRFMAPEHLTGRPNAKSDIYSLGATLYELATRRPAFEKERRKQTVQKILNAEFARPSLVCPGIPRDLEAVILKAMACRPEDRYPNARLLVDDLNRFVAGLPVDARQLAITEKSWRWVKRNRLVATLSACLLVGAVVSFLMIGAEWRTAVSEGRRAEGNLSLALDSMEQILERFSSGWMAHPTTDFSLDGRPLSSDYVLAVEVSNYNASVLEDALRFYDRFTEQNASNPQLKLATARVHRRVGEIYERIGEHKQAEQAFRRSLKLLNSGTHQSTSVEILEQARTLNELGQTLHAVSQFPAAADEFRKARQILSHERFIGNPAFQAETAKAEINLGSTLWLEGDSEEAGRCHRRAIELLENLASLSSEAVGHRLMLASAYRVYARYSTRNGSGANAARLRAAGIEIMERLVSEFPTVPDYRCELSEMLTMSVGRSRRNRQDSTHRVDAERAVDLARKLVTSYPSIPRYRAALAAALNALAGDIRSEKPDAVENLFAESNRLHKELVEGFKGVPVYRLLYAGSLRDHSLHCRRMGDTVAATALLETAIDQQEQFVSSRPDSLFGASILQRMENELQSLTSAASGTDSSDARP